MYKMMAMLHRRADIGRAELIDYYEHHHVALILGLAPAPLVYRRNYTDGTDPVGPDIITELQFADRPAYETWVATMYAPDSGVASDELKFLDRSRTVSYVVEEHVTS